MKGNKDETPPNSRIFVLHEKSTTKDEINEAFKRFGTIEDIWMVRDRGSGENKGVTYVKFTKMSEAAAAVEEMNGVAISDGTRPLKVIIANSRDEGSKKDDDAERFMRLFIVVPKDGSENEESLKEHFSQFGEVQDVTILRNRDTNTPKGFAYIKFTKISDTAKALEGSDPKYKPVLAQPKEKRNEKAGNDRGRNNNNDRRSEPFGNVNRAAFDYDYEPSQSSRHAALCDKYSRDEGYTRVVAFISTQLTEDLAVRLFDLTPGLIFARMSDDIISHRTQKMLLEYATPEAASFAVEKLNGFEYPLKEPIMMKPEIVRKQSSLSMLNAVGERKRGYAALSGRSGDKELDFRTSDKFAMFSNDEPSPLIKSRGLGPGLFSDSDRYCSIKLPPVQPMAKTDDGKHRLFVICKPEAPPVSILKDVFCRFGNLVDVYIIPGKNYGYVHYSTASSANTAMSTVHGEELYGNRIKVVEAEPPREAKKARVE